MTDIRARSGSRETPVRQAPGRLLHLPWPRRRRADVGEALPQYTVSAERHDNALADDFTTIARRLPALTVTALRLAWDADRRAVLLAAVLQLATGAITAIGLYATRGALTPLFAPGPTAERIHTALPSLALITVAAVGRSLIAATTLAVTARIGPRVDAIAELRYLNAATRVPLAAYDDAAWCDHSEAANRASKDAHLMIDALTALTAALLGLLAAAGILTALHPALLPLLLLAVIPRGAAAVRAARAAHLAERHTLSDRRLRHNLIYCTAGRATALDVRANTMRPWLLQQFTTVTDRLTEHAARVGRSTARYQLLGDTMAGGAALLVYGALLWLVLSGHIPAAAAGTAFIAVQTCRLLLTQLITGINSTYKTGLYLGDWSTFLTDAQQRAQLPAAPVPVPARPAVIAAHNISFRYPGSELPVLENISVTVRRGEVLAIVGANGAGKSTLAKLLAGLYTPTTGKVTWDEVDLTTADPDEVWARLALLPQDIARWQVSARENITLGQGDGSDETVMDAARASGADDVIARLPEGLDTSLAPSQWGGRDLSGGQWQRLAGARAFHRKDAPLLICDEPTSALDPRAEEAVYDRIRALSEGRTVILITHRLGSTRAADRIIVLDGGRLLEEGTHESLLADDGEYAALWRTQARSYADQPQR
ncbi:Putative multidrug export ATP-binding/permease protein (plasmid) [Streptomyces sp. YIM 121038]|uniref:ABC transporter ATP-binding protein n=1 Tax=Streptomyces sp. YIM 121038 TaxID=2136401 RepID=UPI00111081BB|nr:ABC transporter ATP-binding protein [Streptomyces sp. YIM 121038]QCX82224.1 Putative multidrug export ATP-binding/permease protein [Streptomyces sp. YIM 121038]